MQSCTCQDRNNNIVGLETITATFPRISAEILVQLYIIYIWKHSEVHEAIYEFNYDPTGQIALCYATNEPKLK